MASAASARTLRVTAGRRKPGRPKGSTNKILNPSKSLPSDTTKRKPGRPKGSTNKVATKSKQVMRAMQAIPRARSSKAAPPVRPLPSPPPRAGVVVKVSKDELRAQVQRLTTSMEKLRAKAREATKAAKAAASRIADLEEQVAQFERHARSAAPDPEPKVAGGKGGRRSRTGRDPGDAVPPGVAVEEPLPLDEEAETVRENLEHHLTRG